MNCAEFEILLCDYLDGTLPSARRAEVARHMEECPACAELARDAGSAVEFMDRAAEVQPPPELITRILFDPPWGKATTTGTGVRRWLGRLLAPVWQPRVVMGAAMTVLSFSMLARFVPVRQLTPEDLQPAKVLASIEDRGMRAWARTLKFYDNLRFVYQIQTTLREWQQQQDEEQKAGAAEAPRPDDRKLDVRKPAAQQPEEKRSR